MYTKIQSLIRCESSIDFAIEYLMTKYEEIEKIFLVDGIIFGKCIRNAILGIPTDRIDAIVLNHNISLICQLFSMTEYYEKYENQKYVFECAGKPTIYIEENSSIEIENFEKFYMLPYQYPGIDIDSIIYSRYIGPIVYSPVENEETLSSVLRKIIQKRAQILEGISETDYNELKNIGFSIYE